MRFSSFVELNAWLSERCRALWNEIRHPEHSQFNVGTRGSLSVNFPKRPVLRFGRSLGGFINSCTSFFQLGAEMLPALRLLLL